MGSLLLRHRAMIQKTTNVDPFSLYATNGMILWLDGIKNTANGHDTNAQYWEDLSGNGHDYKYASANIIHDAFLDINAKGNTLRTYINNNEMASILSGTVEIVYDAAGTGTDARLVLGLGNEQNTVSRKNGSMLFSAASPYKSIAIQTGVHTYSSTLHRDGVAAQNTNVSVSWGTVSGSYLFKFSSGTYDFKGHVYALRVYGRVLTEAEIQQNFQADKIRFGIQ